ncbi:Sua5/YciO/YrdC/YwlC family protein, partial [Candidatus Saccharibacteria bacterium]|nr:Sua5/YciO/YrdC/YwlC family protein [Candidatus Saccharibacteria bacterium]
MTQLYTNILDPQLIKQLNAGGVGVMPTDTLYGLVAQAANQSATEALYKLKGRS